MVVLLKLPIKTMVYLKGDFHVLNYRRLLFAALFLSRAAVKMPNQEFETRADCYQFHCMSWSTRCSCKSLLEMHFVWRLYTRRALSKSRPTAENVLSRMVTLQVCCVSLSYWRDLSKL